MTPYSSFMQSLDQLLLVDQVDLSSPAPLDNEEQYWQLVAAQFYARYWERYLDPARSGRLEMPRFLQEQGLVDGVQHPVEKIRGYCRDRRLELEAHVRACRKLTPGGHPAPRVLRLVERLGLNDDELNVIHYMVLLHSDNQFADYQSRLDETGEIASFLNFDRHQFLRVFSKDSPLILEDVIRMDDGLFSSIRSQDVLMDVPVVRALSGMPLNSDDLLVISETAIEALVRDEPGGDELLEASQEEPGDVDDPDAVLDEFDEDDLIAIDSDPDEFGEQDEVFESEGNGFSLADPSVGAHEPFENDLDYLNAHIDWFMARLHWKKLQIEGRDGMISLDDKKSFSAKLREAQARERLSRAALAQRLELTLEQTDFVPRGEELKQTRGLDDFEKHILLFAAADAASIELREKMETRRSQEAGSMLFLFFDSLEDQVAARRYFYKDATLIRDGLINVSSGAFSGDLLEMDIELDRRMVDYLLGIESESVSLIEGSHLYTPRVALEQVVLPTEQKTSIVESVRHFPDYVRERKRSGLDNVIPYGGGMVLLFHGESGTGKTMLANALAAEMGKKVLLVNYPTIGDMTSDESLKFLIREAKLHDAILFFDECDGIFRDRDRNAGISLLLTELERHDELVILATNRPFDLDEAMERRITTMVEFRIPDTRQREQIWRNHLPQGLRLSATPDIAALAYKYELTGGLIKNAVLAAVSMATGRDPDHPVVQPEDLEEGARRQMRGRLKSANLEDQFVPRVGLDDLVVQDRAAATLRDLIGLEKARSTLVGQWGFTEDRDRGMGATALLAGPPGTGKSMAAEAIAMELGRPVKRVNLAQVVSMWVGQGSKNLESIFAAARQGNAVLVFDEADALFAGRSNVASSTDRYANLEVAVLLREMERFPGAVILTTNLKDHIDEAFIRRLRFVLEFERPDVTARKALWHKLLPSRMPLEEGVDFEALAGEFALSGGQIRNAVVKAASRAALRMEADRIVSEEDLRKAARSELEADSQPGAVGFF